MSVVFMTAFLFTSLKLSAQNDNSSTVPFRCFQTLERPVGDNHSVADNEWKSSNFMVTTDFVIKKIHIYTEKEKIYDLVDEKPPVMENDKTGYPFSGRDQDGNSVVVYMYMYRDQKRADKAVAMLVIADFKGGKSTSMRLKKED